MKDFDLESFLTSNRYIVIALLLGLVLIGVGAFYIKSGGKAASTKVEVLSETTEAQNEEFVVEVVGGGGRTRCLPSF